MGTVSLAIFKPYLPSMCEIISVFGIQGYFAQAELAFLFIREKCFRNLFKKDSKVSLGVKSILKKQHIDELLKHVNQNSMELNLL